MHSIVKQFPKPSVENPALLAQFVRTLAEQYRQAFPAARGFVVESEETKVRNSARWSIRILHGNIAGIGIYVAPGISVPHEVRISAGKTSRLEALLQKAAVVLALLLLLPFAFVALFALRRLGFVLLLGAPVYFVLAAILAGIATLIARLFSRFDHHFDENTLSFAMAAAERLPLPNALTLAQPPSSALSLSQPLQASPQRTGMWPWRGLHNP